MTAQAPDTASTTGVGRLRRRMAVLLAIIALPVVLGVVWVAWREYDQARADVIRQQSGALLARQAGLERLAESAETHVAVMRRYAERRLDQVADLPEYPGTFDWPPLASDPGPAIGALFANTATLTPDERREVTAISAIFSLAEATHATRPYLRWSYYFSDSRAFMALYPWAPASDILGSTPDATLKTFFDYDVFAMGEPAQNPDRTPYWTPVYVDAGGAGLMVTYAAPVWTGGRFRGVVATDVLLSYISTFLDGFAPTIARIAVVDQQGNLIASPGGVALTADVPTRAETLFGTLSLTSTDGAFVARDADLLSVSPIPGTPWLLVTDLQLAQIRAQALARVTPLLALLTAVLAGLMAAVVLFSRQFVLPAVALVDYGALPAATAITRDLPALPEVWRPLAQRVLTGSRAQATQTAQLRAMVDGVPLRVVYLDSQRILRDANREFLAFAGLERSAVLGQPLAHVMGDAVDTQVAAMAPAIQRGETSRFEGWQTYRDQGSRFVQMSILPFTPPGEAAAGFLTFTRDLTDLKAAETEAARSLASLAERESRYRSVVVSALDAIIVMDDAGLAVEFNPTAERVFGYTAAEAVGRPVGDLIVPPAARLAHAHGMDRYLATNDPHVIGKRIEVEAMRKDGSLLPVELTVTEMQSGANRLFISHLRDLTDSRRLARDMQDSRDRLHQVEKLSAMGSLLAGVAHELNNPLAIAVAQSTILVERAPDAAIRARAERIRAAAERCGRIVKSFLAMARQKPPQREPTQLAPIIEAALEVVGYGLRSSGIEVETRLPADLPPTLADRDLMGQVISNLLINAQQALSHRPAPRQIRITARTEAQVLFLRIEDNGPGVPDSLRNRIFDPYFTTKAVEVGTGIGLSISRNVIEAHGGAITLATGDLPGACFEIRLPVSTITDPVDAEPVAPHAAGRTWRVLIVDDEPDVGTSLAEMIELAGHRADVVTTGRQALDLIRTIPFDAVFSDLRMPGMDGAEFAQHLRDQAPDLARRLDIMTGDTFAGPPHLAQAGLADLPVLEKPFTQADVTAALRQALP